MNPDCKKRRYQNEIELVTRPGGRRLSGAESIDLSFCLDPAGLSLQYSNGHSPTHRWYRQNIPRNSAKQHITLHRSLCSPQRATYSCWYFHPTPVIPQQEVPAPLEENSGTYLSDPLHTTTNPAKRNWKGLLTRVSASFQDNSTKIHNSPKAIRNKIFTYRSNRFWTSIAHTFNLRTTTLQMINMFGKVRNTNF